MRERDRSDPGRLALARARHESTLAYQRYLQPNFKPLTKSNFQLRSSAQAMSTDNDSPHRDDPSYVSPGRAVANDSPERRRPNRGRANGRPNQPSFSRSTQAGFSRLASSQRAVLGLSPPSAGSTGSFGAPRRIIPSAPNNISPSAASTMSSNRASTGSGVLSTGSEEASPAVAVGSFVAGGDRVPEQYPNEFGGGASAAHARSQDATARLNVASNNPSPTSSIASTLVVRAESPRWDQENFSAGVFAFGSAQRTRTSYDPALDGPVAVQRERGSPGSPASVTFRPRWTR